MRDLTRLIARLSTTSNSGPSTRSDPLRIRLAMILSCRVRASWTSLRKTSCARRSAEEGSFCKILCLFVGFFSESSSAYGCRPLQTQMMSGCRIEDMEHRRVPEHHEEHGACRIAVETSGIVG